MAGGGMSMTWMRMDGQSWAGAMASFVAMWTVMMAAMMLPSLVPMLHRYRVAIGRVSAGRAAFLTALVALGYFAVWSALGAMVFPLGLMLANAELRLTALARIAPVGAGVVVLLAGAMQLTRWKAHHLAWDRREFARARATSANVAMALRHGISLGVHCGYCCAGFTASLLAFGVMDLRMMAVVTAAITAERVAPDGARAARAIGVAGIVTGTLLIACAVGSG